MSAAVEDVYEELADWYVRLDREDATAADRTEFARWLTESAVRQRAHADMAAGLEALTLAAAEPAVFDEALAPALAGATDAVAGTDNVVTLPRRPSRRPAWRRIAAVAAALLLFVVAGAALLPSGSRYTEVATAIGAIRKLDLADGSTIHMNTNTRLAYEVGPDERRVRIDSGEAYFEVARDPERPFVVAVGDHTITVVGTAFDVRLSDGQVRLAVTEGVTRIEPAGTLARLLGTEKRDVRAGTAALFGDGAPVRLEQIKPSAGAGGWRTGRLVYRDRPLAEILADVGRYLHSELKLSDARRGADRFTMVLQVGDEAVMLERMGQLLPITLRQARPSLYEVGVR